MKHLLTIIIPSKNEGKTLRKCLYKISKQYRIDGVKVIVADASNDDSSLDILFKTKNKLKNLNIHIIQGGYPSVGRLAGSKLADTPYILFLDADVILKDKNLLFFTLGLIASNEHIHLVTTPFQTNKKWNWVFRLFDISQYFSKLLGTPFAVGGFQLWNIEKYWKIGGYNSEEIFAEDYSISSKVKPKNFYIYKTNSVYTSPRRFENKGFLFMFIIMIKSYLNRHNPDFFKNHHNYWN